jgi:hypothetical protein
MNKKVSWIFELSVNDGELSNLKELMKEMVDSVEANEPGTLAMNGPLTEMENCAILTNATGILQQLSHI